jgi:hypothetical protein
LPRITLVPAQRSAGGPRARYSFDLWVELIPYLETRRYVKRVLGSAAVYAIVYQEADAQLALGLPSMVGGKTAIPHVACGRDARWAVHCQAFPPVVGVTSWHAPPSNMRALGTPLPTFSLVDVVSGKTFSSSRASGQARGGDFHLQPLPVREAHRRGARRVWTLLPR